MNFNEFKTLVITACQEAGVTEYELYYQAGSSLSVGVFQHSVNEFTASTSGGVCLRCIAEGKMGYASTEDLSPEQAKLLVTKAVDAASCLESEEQVFLGEGGQVYETVAREPYELPTTEELIRTVLATQEKLYAADPAVIDGTESKGISEHYEIAIYNSKGLDLSYRGNASGLIAVGVVSDGTDMANDFRFKLGKLDTIDTDELAKTAVENAKVQLGGGVAPTGQYDVVFSPDAMRRILQVFSSVFSSEAAQKGLSRLADKEGQIIAAPMVSLVDDPFHPESPEPIPFDAEGSPTHKKHIIRDGKLNTLLYNLKTAAVAGKKTTGNAAKAGYDSAVMVRPFTMYLENGNKTPEELMQMAEGCVLITKVEGLHAGANAISGDFSLQSFGFMIEDGKKGEYVRSFTVAGNFYELLKNIKALANDCQVPMATGMTAFGSPTVLVGGLSIAGK